MEEYKKINKQLIVQIQDMRLREASYRNDVAELCKRLLEERQRRVELQQKFIEVITRNFRETLTEINPDSHLLKVLNDENFENEHCAEHGSGSDAQRSGQINKQRRHSSSRRSSNGMQRRYTAVIKSPIPRRSSGQNGLELTNIRDVGAYRELHESITDSNKVIEEVTEQDADSSTDSNKNDEQNVEIIEDIEEEEDTNDSDEEDVSAFNVDDDEQSEEDESASDAINDTSAEPQTTTPKLDIIGEEHEEIVVREQRKRQGITNTSKPSPLRDITNKQISTAVETVADLEMNDSNASTKSKKLPHVILKRGRKTRHSANNDSVELPRFQIDQCNETAGKEGIIAIDSCSFAFSESTIRNIGDAPCSTPRNLRSHNAAACASNAATLGMHITEASSTALGKTTANQSGRPSRRCKPTSFVEPKINSKMRNESSVTIKKPKINK